MEQNDKPQVMGKLTTRRVAPMALAGMLLVNCARTAPPLPCERMTLPQMTRIYVKMRQTTTANRQVQLKITCLPVLVAFWQR